MDDRTFVDILRDRAQVSGDKIAYRFLVDGDKEELTLTYGQLHQRALAIASRLKDEAKPGDRALLLYPPGLEFICAFFGCLYAGVIAVPAYPPGKSRLIQNVKRLELLSRNCTHAVVLCDNDIRDILNERITDEVQQSVLAQIEHKTSQDNSSLALLKAKVISTTRINESVSESLIITPSAQDLAFLQYTSGSTGNPKGVMVSHGNCVANSAQLKITHHQTDSSVVTSWLPIYHDMGLIGPFFQSIYTGCLSVIFSPVAFIKTPLSWLRLICNVQSSCSGAPNFAYQLCVDAFSEEKMEGVDLSCWKVAYCGAEPIQKNTIEKFIETYKEYGFNPNAFFPVYGMAEHTLMISAGSLGEPYGTITIEKKDLSDNKAVEAQASEFTQTFVSCGRALDGHGIAIVEPETKTFLADNNVGEIWCQGLSVARGYCGNEAANKETFHARTADGQGPYLRTGDLGFMKDGELYIVGRLKDMIIIRGRNYAPQDVEYAVEVAHEGVRKGCVAAFGFEDQGVEKLTVVCEVERAFVKKDHDDIIQAIIKNITQENELSVSAIVLLKPGQIFKTTSGKIQRSKNRFYLNTDIPVLYRHSQAIGFSKVIELEYDNTNDFQTRLNTIIASVSGSPISPMLNHDVDLMDLGLDSLMLVELQNRVEMEFIDEVDINDASLSAIKTYSELLGYLNKNKIPLTT